MTECNKCGNCCESIWLSATKEYLRETLRSSNATDNQREDARFVLKHWKSTGKREGSRHFFSCDQFNAETRLCEAHDSRPPICANYPWYGNEPSIEKAKSMDSECEFWRDIDENLWPQRVTLTRKKK